MLFFLLYIYGSLFIYNVRGYTDDKLEKGLGLLLRAGTQTVATNSEHLVVTIHLPGIENVTECVKVFDEIELEVKKLTEIPGLSGNAADLEGLNAILTH
jgi:hypothetical protein